VFPLTTEKDGKRRGRYHALDELQYARRLAGKAQLDNIGPGSTAAAAAAAAADNSLISTDGLQLTRRRIHRRRNLRAADAAHTTTRPPYTHVRLNVSTW